MSYFSASSDRISSRNLLLKQELRKNLLQCKAGNFSGMSREFFCMSREFETKNLFAIMWQTTYVSMLPFMDLTSAVCANGGLDGRG